MREHPQTRDQTKIVSVNILLLCCAGKVKSCMHIHPFSEFKYVMEMFFKNEHLKMCAVSRQLLHMW